MLPPPPVLRTMPAKPVSLVLALLLLLVVCRSRGLGVPDPLGRRAAAPAAQAALRRRLARGAWRRGGAAAERKMDGATSVS
mmetsp:Transcript_4209/g.12772  ORF Transcript_4209/g.12772 Transcript_4209/m.12772 type:complete len:81 (+) Transcript_4209:804-1046(+)